MWLDWGSQLSNYPEVMQLVNTVVKSVKFCCTITMSTSRPKVKYKIPIFNKPQQSVRNQNIALA